MAVQEQILRPSGQAPSATPAPFAGDEAFGAGLGRAIEGAGGQLEASSMRAMRAERERQEDAANAEAAKGAAQLSLDLTEMAAGKREEAPEDGGGHVDAVTNEANARIASFLGGIGNERVRQRWSARTAEIRANLIGDEDGWARGQRIESIGRNGKEAGRLWDNQLQSNPDPAAFDQALKAGDDFWQGVRVPEKVRAEGLREWKATRSANYLEGLIEKDPAAAKAVIASGALDLWLDAKDKRRLLDASDSEMRIAAADLRRQQSQQESQLREDVTEYTQRVDRGELPDDKEATALAARAQTLGLTNLVDDLEYVQGKAKLSRETDKWTSTDWEQNVNTLAAKVAAGKASPQEQVTLRALQELRPAKEGRFRNDPEGHAAASGIPAPVVDLANPAPATVRDRKSWARAFARTGGLIEPPYLSKGQIAVYRDRAAQGPVGRLEVAAELRQVWGMDAAPSIVRSIGGEAKGDMLIMLGLNPRMAQVYGRGVTALEKLTVKLGDDGLRQVFADYAAAIPPDVRPAVFDAARNIMAGWMSEQGKTEPTANWADVFRQALHRAAGMVGSVNEGAATGGFVNFNGRFAWLPPEMSRQDFARRVSRAAASAWVDAAVDERGNPTGKGPWLRGADGKLVRATVGQAQRFASGTFQTVAAGIYRVIDRFGEPVLDEKGRPWLVDVRRLK